MAHKATIGDDEALRFRTAHELSSVQIAAAPSTAGASPISACFRSRTVQAEVSACLSCTMPASRSRSRSVCWFLPRTDSERAVFHGDLTYMQPAGCFARRTGRSWNAIRKYLRPDEVEPASGCRSNRARLMSMPGDPGLVEGGGERAAQAEGRDQAIACRSDEPRLWALTPAHKCTNIQPYKPEETWVSDQHL
jgi:hypothetical protein